MEEVTLRLLLVNGDSHQFKFESSVSVDDVVRHVFTNWPSDWSDPSADRPQLMRLIYRGKILHKTDRLSDLSLGKGVTVMHLVMRERTQSDHNESGARSNTVKTSHCCTIL